MKGHRHSYENLFEVKVVGMICSLLCRYTLIALIQLKDIQMHHYWPQLNFGNLLKDFQ